MSAPLSKRARITTGNEGFPPIGELWSSSKKGILKQAGWNYARATGTAHAFCYVRPQVTMKLIKALKLKENEDFFFTEDAMYSWIKKNWANNAYLQAPKIVTDHLTQPQEAEGPNAADATPALARQVSNKSQRRAAAGGGGSSAPGAAAAAAATPAPQMPAPIDYDAPTAGAAAAAAAPAGAAAANTGGSANHLTAHGAGTEKSRSAAINAACESAMAELRRKCAEDSLPLSTFELNLEIAAPAPKAGAEDAPLQLPNNLATFKVADGGMLKTTPDGDAHYTAVVWVTAARK